MSQKLINDILSAVQQAGVTGVNVFVIVEKDEEKEEEKQEFESPFDDLSYEGIFGGGVSGGGSGENSILLE